MGIEDRLARAERRLAPEPPPFTFDVQTDPSRACDGGPECTHSMHVTFRIVDARPEPPDEEQVWLGDVPRNGR